MDLPRASGKRARAALAEGVVTADNLSACCRRDRIGVGGDTCGRDGGVLALSALGRCALMGSIVVLSEVGGRWARRWGTRRECAWVTRSLDRLPKVHGAVCSSGRDPSGSVRSAAASGGWRAAPLCLSRLPRRQPLSPDAGPRVEALSGVSVRMTGIGGGAALGGGGGGVAGRRCVRSPPVRPRGGAGSRGRAGCT